MPTRKSSPSKAKKSPKPKSKSRSRSRSRSVTKKAPVQKSRSPSSTKKTPSQRSRSQSASRSIKSETRISQKATPAKSTKPAPKATPPQTVEAEIKPTRVSRRIEERVTYQVTKSAVSGRGDGAKSKGAAAAAYVPSGAGVGRMGVFLVVFLIALTYFFSLTCSKTQCSLMKLPKISTKWQDYLNLEAAAVVVGYYIVVAALSLIPVGAVVQGMPLKDGSRLEYRCNGWLTLVLLAGGFGYAIQRGCSLTYFEDHYLQILTSSVILTLVLAFDAIICARNTPTKDWSPSADGTFLNDFVMGRALNPRFKGIDYKFVLVRASLLSWLLIDWMYMAARFKANQTVEPAMAFVVLTHTLYCMFVVKNEATLFSGLDFMSEGFGFTFAWGTVCFVPFGLSQQVRFLYFHPEEGVDNKYVLGALLILHVIGLIFYIGSNWQKDQFRRNPYNPELSHLTSIPTSTGKRLLTSGWWGIVRHPNYLGDLTMAVTWSVACGCNYGLPYFYFVYLIMMLVSRTISNETSCRQRYGEVWDRYTDIVPYRLIPYVF